MSVTRKYNCKDTECIIGCTAVNQAGQAHQAFLATQRSVWSVDYFSEFEEKINLAASTYLGVDNAVKLRNQTIAVNSIVEPALKAVSRIRLEINEGYKSVPVQLKEIRTTLGYTKWSGTKEQEGLITLLFAIKQNMTPEIKADLIAKGSLPALITDILGYGQTLLDANVTQEFFKQSKKVLTEAAITEFNEIYKQAVSICKLSRNYFAGNTPVQDQFSFAKILAALNPGTISTLFDQQVSLQPGTLFTSLIKLTSKSKVTLTLLDNVDGVYACRNADGCYPSHSEKLIFEVHIELTKATLNGTGNYLIISNPLAQEVKVQVIIQG